MKLLVTLAEFDIPGTASPESPSRALVALLLGYENGSKSAGFVKAASGAKTNGFIEYPSSKSMCLTRKGKDSVAPHALNRPQSNADVHLRIKKLLTTRAVELFDVLADGFPRDREKVARTMRYDDAQV